MRGWLVAMDNSYPLKSRLHQGLCGVVNNLTWLSRVRTFSWATPSCPARLRFSSSSLVTMSIARVGVVSRGRSLGGSLVSSGGRSRIRYSLPYWPVVIVAGILPSLMWRLTVLVDIPRVLAAWAMVKP